VKTKNPKIIILLQTGNLCERHKLRSICSVLVLCLSYFSTLKIEEKYSSETSGGPQQTAYFYISEERTGNKL
jgi:hypothetical protein